MSLSHYQQSQLCLSRPPTIDAARHGTGDAHPTVMIAAHQGFRRDPVRIVREFDRI